MKRLVIRGTLSALLGLLATFHSAEAVFNGIQVNVNQLGLDIAGDAANEPSIAVDPTNPHRMAIGWRQFDTISSDFRQAGVAFTTDGGQTWTANTLDAGQFRSDPVLDYDNAGNFYYASLSSLTTVEIFKSTNGGATWSNPVPSFGGDKEWIAVDRSGGIGDGNIYHHWNEQFSGVPGTNFTRSTNGGASYEPSIAGPMPFMKWGTMDVGPDGTLHLVGATLSQSGHLYSRSANAQDPLQIPSFSASQSVNLGGVTSFGGVNPDGLLGQVQVATDHSQADGSGNVYILASVNPAGSDPLNVNFIRSTDGGVTWSNPIRVNNDAPGSNAFQWFGTMSVAPNGRIDVVWNDTRNDPTNGTSELFYAYSWDEGMTWIGNSAISAPFDHSLGYPMQDKLGDYYDMIFVAYAATYNGGQDVYFRRILQCDYDASGSCDVDDLNSLFQEGPIDVGVPVSAGGNDRFDLNGDGLLDLSDRDAWLSQAGNANGFSSPYRLGDVNLDGFVDGSDFNVWNGNKFTASLNWDDGNFNGDGFVDGSDFNLWNGNKFTASDGGPLVPEPAVGLHLLFLVLAGTVCRRGTKET
jgi:hypothetical protein